MEITEVRIKLMEDGGDRLKAFCSITFDNCFVIRDLKIIEGTSGPFVAMPSRKLTSHCPDCHCKNHLRAAYCNQCGVRLKDDRAIKDEDGRAKLYADIAHPINSSCREMIQDRVIAEFQEELEKATKPGYVSRYDEYDFDMPDPHFAPSGGRDRGAAGPSECESPKREHKPRVEQAQSEKTGPHKDIRGEKAPKPKTTESFGEGIF